MTTGQKIETQRRKTPGMCQEKLAENLGITAQAYRNKITGRSSFKMHEMVAAAAALQVRIEQFMENVTAPQEDLAKSERDFFKRLLQEQNEEIQFLRNLLRKQ